MRFGLFSNLEIENQNLIRKFDSISRTVAAKNAYSFFESILKWHENIFKFFSGNQKEQSKSKTIMELESGEESAGKKSYDKEAKLLRINEKYVRGKII